ncbi:MAG: hypothetical protein VB084_03125 [Syntrophomonadaceae bacterium]|nr:hypothetical protein [Syntrophomonadaceae bacterium]
MALQKILGGSKNSLHLWVIAALILAPSIWLSSYNKAYFLGVILGSYVTLPLAILILLLASISMAVKNKKSGCAAR